MAEGVEEYGDAAPLSGANVSFKLRAGGDSTLHGRIDIRDDEIEVNRSPVTGVIAALW